MLVLLMPVVCGCLGYIYITPVFEIGRLLKERYNRPISEPKPKTSDDSGALYVSETAQTHLDRKEELLSTYLGGWLGIMVANCIIPAVLLVYFDNLAHLLWPFVDAVLVKVAAYMALRVPLRVIQWYFKKFLFLHCLGMSAKHFDPINQDRLQWNGEEIDLLEASYGQRRIKMYDAINKRSFHIFMNGIRAVFYLGISKDTIGALQTAFVLYSINSALMLAFEKQSGIVASVIYLSARMRDGILGRMNVLSVIVWEYTGSLLALVILTVQEESGAKRGFFFCAGIQCVMWGDTFGEVIGSFFGKYQFPVWGIGEVNYKTLEGTLATYVSNFVSLILVLQLQPEEGTFRFSLLAVATIVALVGTVAEVMAVRSTDNFFMLVACVITLLLLRAWSDGQIRTRQPQQQWPRRCCWSEARMKPA